MVCRLPLLLSLLVPAAVLAQRDGFGGLFDQAPPHIENALRERVNLFFQRLQEGKYRQADEVVHEDSKDAFFVADKLKVKAFKILNFVYEENFTRARTVLDLSSEYHFPGFKKMDVNIPWVSFWKLDQGEWWWYTTGSSTKSPFGPFKPGPDGSAPASIEEVISERIKEAGKLGDRVKVDKTEVNLASHEQSEDWVTIKNEFDGPIHLQVQHPDMPGFVAVPEKLEVPVGETIRMRFFCNPQGAAKKADLQVIVLVSELGRKIPINVRFAYPPNQEPAPGARTAPVLPRK